MGGEGGGLKRVGTNRLKTWKIAQMRLGGPQGHGQRKGFPLVPPRPVNRGGQVKPLRIKRGQVFFRFPV